MVEVLRQGRYYEELEGSGVLGSGVPAVENGAVTPTQEATLWILTMVFGRVILMYR